MKILTCFIPPSAGEAKVCGFDGMKDPIEVKKSDICRSTIRSIPTCTCREYLEFAARMQGMKKFERVEEMIAVTGIVTRGKKKIGQGGKVIANGAGLALQAMLTTRSAHPG